MGRFLSPDWVAKARAGTLREARLSQSLNLYGYVGNDPLSTADPDGHSWLLDQLKKGLGAISFEDLLSYVGIKPKKPDQPSVSFSETFSLPAEKVPEEEVREPNDVVALVADTAGILSAADVVRGAPGLMLGLGGLGLSSVNDASNNLNLSINATGNTLAGLSYVAEGTAVGTGATFGGFAVAVGAVAWDLDNLFVNHVLSSVFNAAPTQKIQDGNHMISNPELAEPYSDPFEDN